MPRFPRVPAAPNRDDVEALIDRWGKGLGLKVEKKDPPASAPRLSVGTAQMIVTDNRSKAVLPIRDQGRTNYCVHFACNRLQEIREVEAGREAVELSTLASAWWTLPAGERGTNVGTWIRAWAESAQREGRCSDLIHPWATVEADYLTRMKLAPSKRARNEAARHQVLEVLVLPDHDPNAYHAAVEEGYAFAFGVPLWSSFYSTPNTGIVATPSGSFLGWHAMVLRDADRRGTRWGLVGDNSWSTDWGAMGTFWMPDEYLAKAEDVRAVKIVEAA